MDLLSIIHDFSEIWLIQTGHANSQIPNDIF